MRSLVPALTLALLAAPAGAQLAPAAVAAAPVVALVAAPTAAASMPAAATVTAGAPVADAAVGLRPARVAGEAHADAAYQRARRRGYGRSVALMATGGAAVVLGALAGGDAGGVLILGGAVVGLIGLYDYLR